MNCEHRWGETIPQDSRHRWTPKNSGTKHTASGEYPKERGQWCQVSGCWRGHLGLECTPFCTDAMQGQDCTDQCYLGHLLQVADALWRVLRDDGVMLINLGDSYCSTDKWGGGKNGNTGKHTVGENGDVPSWAVRQKRQAIPGLKPKNLMGMPWRLAIALQARSWTLRSAIPWLKTSSMPESVQDRVSVSHEMVFLFSKKATYFWDPDAIRGEASPVSIARIQQRTFYSQTGGPKDYQHGTNPNNSARKALEHFAENPGRNRRTGDWWKESLDRLIADTDAWLAHAKQVRANGGLLLSPDGEPLGLHVNPQPFAGSHFATFAPKLIEPLIKASTSEKGCCATCQAPWAREGKQSPEVLGHAIRVLREQIGWSREQLAHATKKGPNNVWDWEVGGHIPSGKHWDVLATALNLPFSRDEFIEQAEYIATGSQSGPKQVAAREQMGVNRPYSERKLRLRTIDTKWQPTCTCHEHTTAAGWRYSQWPLPEPIPCTVLDPFLGSGTSALVARNLGRRAVGLELSPAYLELAIKRLRQQVLPFTEVQAPAHDGHDTTQAEIVFDA